MVFGEVGEYSIVEFTACHTAKDQGMGRNFHAHVLHFFLRHAGQNAVQIDHIRRRIVGGDFLISDEGMNGADDTGFMAGMVKDMCCYMGGGCLPVGTGQGDHAHFPCGIIKEKRYHIFHSLPCIFDIYHSHRRRHIYIPGSYNGSSTLFYSCLDKVMSIHMGTGKADK